MSDKFPRVGLAQSFMAELDRLGVENRIATDHLITVYLV